MRVGATREHHFGEGDYEQSERIIQRLLAEAGAAGRDASIVSVDGVGVEAPADWASLKSPENYLGHDRTENFASPRRGRLGSAPPLRTAARLALNQWALTGEWTMGRRATVRNSPNGRIACRFHARDLHLVMGPPRQGAAVRFRVTIDGQPPGSAHGADVDERGNGTAADQRLYQLIRQSRPIVDRQFDIEFLDAGVEAFAFTFG